MGRRVDLRITAARTARGHAAVQDLLMAYAAQWQEALGHQDLCHEALWVAETYAPPDAMLAAWQGDAAVGCVGVKGLGDGRCEMKRMFVQPSHRDRGVGRALAEAAMATAREAGHRRMVLDTTTAMEAAIGLYRGLGFRPIGAYYDSPCQSPVFLGLDL